MDDYYSQTTLSQLREDLDRCNDDEQRELIQSDIDQIEEYFRDWSRESGEYNG